MKKIIKFLGYTLIASIFFANQLEAMGWRTNWRSLETPWERKFNEIVQMQSIVKLELQEKLDQNINEIYSYNLNEKTLYSDLNSQETTLFINHMRFIIYETCSQAEVTRYISNFKIEFIENLLKELDPVSKNYNYLKNNLERKEQLLFDLSKLKRILSSLIYFEKTIKDHANTLNQKASFNNLSTQEKNMFVDDINYITQNLKPSNEYVKNYLSNFKFNFLESLEGIIRSNNTLQNKIAYPLNDLFSILQELLTNQKKAAQFFTSFGRAKYNYEVFYDLKNKIDRAEITLEDLKEQYGSKFVKRFKKFMDSYK